MKFEVGKIYQHCQWENYPVKNQFGQQKISCGWILPPNSKFILLEYVERVHYDNIIYNLKILFEGKVGWIYSSTINFLTNQS